MTISCPVHLSEMRMIPAGISKKTNKPYKAFYVCSTEGCTEKGPAPQVEVKEPFDKGYSVPRQQEVFTDRDKSSQIARLTLAKTFIQAGVDFDNAVKNNDLEKWELYVMTGKSPAEQMKDEVDSLLEE